MCIRDSVRTRSCYAQSDLIFRTILVLLKAWIVCQLVQIAYASRETSEFNIRHVLKEEVKRLRLDCTIQAMVLSTIPANINSSSSYTKRVPEGKNTILRGDSRAKNKKKKIT